MGIEVDVTDDVPLVAPGLGLGVNPGLDLYKQLLDYYSPLHFLNEDGTLNQVTIVKHTTNVLVANGLKPINSIQCVAGVWIYPRDFFNPLDDNTGKLVITENTRSIHWYTKTWLKKRHPLVTWLIRIIHRYFGNDSLAWIKKMFR